MSGPTRTLAQTFAVAVTAVLGAVAPLAAQGETPPGSSAEADPGAAPKNPFKPFDRAAFIRHARTLGADDAAITAYETQCKEESVAIATESLLCKLEPKLEAAIVLAEDGDPRAALELAALIEGGADSHIRAFARYHLGRHFLDGDDPDMAAAVLVEYLREDKNRTPLDAEVAFFYGTALADIPRPEHAAITFGDFLMLFPDAPERYRAVAAQRKAELEAQFESPLHDIADTMKGLRRDLRRKDTGKDTQETQEEVLQKLQKIIEELEQQEQQSSGAPGGSQSNSPAANSALPGGESRIGSLRDAPKVAKRWGEYNQRDRKAIEAEVNMRLSGPWKKIVGEYFKKLNKGSDR